MNSLDELLQQVPEWVEVESRKSKKAVIRATCVRDSGALGDVYSLAVEQLASDRIKIYETKAEQKLPKCCVERHINSDSSFCLHLDSSKPVGSPKAARDWWNSLARYLSNQEYAARFGRWPINQGLSHGDAATTQVEMERLADTVGWRDEVLSSIFRGTGFLHDAPLRLSKDKSRFVNLRTPCPRGCKRLHFPYRKRSCERHECKTDCQRDHRPILRASCPNRDVIERLNRLEIKRRSQERELLNDLKQSKTPCCGTMKDCPLA